MTSIVIKGKRISKHSLTRKVGHGSSKQDFDGEFAITFRTLSSETNLKRSNLGTLGGAGRVKGVFGKESIISLILSEKKVTKRLPRPS